jgi:hypothetical protein
MRNDHKSWKKGVRVAKQFGGPLVQPGAQPLARPGVAPARPLGFKKGGTAKAGGGYIYKKK